jgi:hypothetical protein
MNEEEVRILYGKLEAIEEELRLVHNALYDVEKWIIGAKNMIKRNITKVGEEVG